MNQGSTKFFSIEDGSLWNSFRTVIDLPEKSLVEIEINPNYNKSVLVPFEIFSKKVKISMSGAVHIEYVGKVNELAAVEQNYFLK